MSESGDKGPGEDLMAPGAIKTRADFEEAQNKGEILKVVEHGIKKDPEVVESPSRRQLAELDVPVRRAPVDAQAETGRNLSALEPEQSGEEQQASEPEPETERIVSSPPKDKTEGGENTEGTGKPKPEEAAQFAKATTEELLISVYYASRELLTRLVRHMKA